MNRAREPKRRTQEGKKGAQQKRLAVSKNPTLLVRHYNVKGRVL